MDMVKMYRQILIHPDDWNLQRNLWLDDQLKDIILQLTTVTYGTKAGPFLATRALLLLVEDEGHRFPLAVPSIRLGRYVDDIFGGADTVRQLTEVAHQVQGLCNAGGFPLSKWHTTHEDLPTAVSTEVAQIFDPLGFVAPVIINAKIILQELWLLMLGWNDPLPDSVRSKWLNIREGLISLASISIPRWFGNWSFSTIQLHGFSDASQDAMAAVIYLVVNSPSTGSTTSLICSKTKLAPLKKLTISRLELTAALLLAILAHQIKDSLHVKMEATHLWTDSQVTLMWINSHASRWKDYDRKRVAQVQDMCKINTTWRHVPGEENPADCGFRGISTAHLKNHALWWTGPQWIQHSADQRPAEPSKPSPQADVEVRPGVTLIAMAQQPAYHWNLIHRYSSLNRLLIVTTLLFRTRDVFKRTIDSLPASRCTAQDLQHAQVFWIKATQAAYFAQEFKTLSQGSALSYRHAFSRLTAFIDAEGIIRVGGRLNQSALSFREKHPAILPRCSQLTSLLVDAAHRVTLHGGTQFTLANLRQTCWIVGGRPSVKAHVLRCVPCARQRSIRAQQFLGQVPVYRITPSRAFSHTGIDYAGSVTLKTWKGRGCKTQKRWICVFVCMLTSAAHLEVVSDYSADGYLAAYRRFVSPRGLVEGMYSDCGTTFQEAETELKCLFTQSARDHQALSTTLALQGTTWHFIPPATPHMGGKWEALVKFEELTTLLTQIEAVLNSRLLEPLSDDPNDVSALTPGHFLIGSALNSVPEPSLLDLPTARLARWQLIQQRLQSYWSQWLTHYLQRQQSISKWHLPSHTLQVEMAAR